jgi:hypothetical protein
MKSLHCLRGIFVVALAVLAFGPGVTARAQNSPSADEIMQRAVARAESSSSRDGRPDYLYRKHTVTEQMDSKGRLKERQEKTFDVSVIGGLSELKLVQLNGQELSPAELKKEDDREAAERQKMTDAKPGQKGDERENFLTADLVAKYKFTLKGEKDVDGRQTYELAFEPKSPSLPIHKLTDRFLNQVAGTVWIDAQEYEISRAEIHLQGEVTLWGGMVGTLTQCNYTLARTRLPDGVWFNNFSHGYFEGRKLLEPMSIRTRSQSSDFRRRDLALNN